MNNNKTYKFKFPIFGNILYKLFILILKLFYFSNDIEKSRIKTLAHEVADISLLIYILFIFQKTHPITEEIKHKIRI